LDTVPPIVVTGLASGPVAIHELCLIAVPSLEDCQDWAEAGWQAGSTGAGKHHTHLRVNAKMD